MTSYIQNNQITLLQNGEAYFQTLGGALDLAVHDIYLESYIFKNDGTGQCIAQALKRAALRGVKTHMLIGGFGSMKVPKTMIDDLEAAGVWVMKSRPKTSPWTVRRLHRKIVVVDRLTAFVGGINIIDDMDQSGQPSPRYDYAACVQGPLVNDIHDSTQRVWSRVAWTRLRSGRRWDNGRQTQAAKEIRTKWL